MSQTWFPLVASLCVLVFDLAVLLVVSPGYAQTLDTWDGHHFLDIAAEGYPATPARSDDGVISDPRWAFYPIFPLVVRAVVVVTGLEAAWAVLLINGIALATAMTVFYVLSRRFLSTAESRAAVALTVTSMAMPVTLLAYSDIIALLLLMLLFAGVAARSYRWVALTVLVLSLIRPVVAPLAVVFVVCAVDAWRRRSAADVSPWPWVFLTMWASVCAFIWPTVAGLSTGRCSTYWDTETAYQEPGMSRSWLAWALWLPPLGVIVTAIVFLVVVWAAARDSPTEHR